MDTCRPLIVEGNVRSFIKNKNYIMLNPSFYFDKNDKSLVIFSNLFRGMYIYLYNGSEEYKEYCRKAIDYKACDFLPALMKVGEEDKLDTVFDSLNMVVFNEAFVNKKIFELADPGIINHKIQDILNEKWMAGYCANREDLENEFIYRNSKDAQVIKNKEK